MYNDLRDLVGIYVEAEKLFNFFCDHVDFPEDSTNQMLGGLLPVIEGILGGYPAEKNADKLQEEFTKC